MGEAIVQKHFVAHCVENVRAERRCVVPVRSVHASMDEPRSQSGDVGTRIVYIVCEWYVTVLSRLIVKTVAKFRVDGAKRF